MRKLQNIRKFAKQIFAMSCEIVFVKRGYIAKYMPCNQVI